MQRRKRRGSGTYLLNEHGRWIEAWDQQEATLEIPKHGGQRATDHRELPSSEQPARSRGGGTPRATDLLRESRTMAETRHLPDPTEPTGTA